MVRTGGSCRICDDPLQVAKHKSLEHLSLCADPYKRPFVSIGCVGVVAFMRALNVPGVKLKALRYFQGWPVCRFFSFLEGAVVLAVRCLPAGWETVRAGCLVHAL